MGRKEALGHFSLQHLESIRCCGLMLWVGSTLVSRLGLRLTRCYGQVKFRVMVRFWIVVRILVIVIIIFYYDCRTVSYNSIWELKLEQNRRIVTTTKRRWYKRK